MPLDRRSFLTSASAAGIASLATRALGAPALPAATNPNDPLLSARIFNVRDFGAALDGKQDDSPAIMAAFNAMKLAGHPTGTLLIPGLARIAATIDLDGGYRNTTSEGQWSAGHGERFSVIVQGALRPDPGIKTAVHLHGHRGAYTDIHLDKGGKSTDVGLLCEDLDLCDIGVGATDFAGTVLRADASADASKRIRSTKIRELYASNCGRAVYWRAIEAFGSFQFIWDRNCVEGSQFEDCADVTIQYFENFSPDTQTVGLNFVECNNFSVGILSLGDRPKEALVKITGGDFGSINKIRVSGHPHPPKGFQPPVGLKLVNVKSLNIDNLLTFRCGAGLHAIGSSFTIKRHHSLTGDVNPLLIEGSKEFPAPRMELGVLYRYHQRESVKIADNLAGGSLRLHGRMYDMNTSETPDLSAIDCRSEKLLLDVAGLTIEARATITKSISHPNPANVVGVSQARLAIPLVHGQITERQIALGAAIQNTSDRPLTLHIPVEFQPAKDAHSSCEILLGPTSEKLITVVSARRPAPQTDTLTVRIPPWWWYRIEVKNASPGKAAAYFD